MDRAAVVLVCEPSVETLFAVLNTEAANFLRSFAPAEAVLGHRMFRARLERAGVRVVDVREALRSLDLDASRNAR